MIRPSVVVATVCLLLSGLAGCGEEQEPDVTPEADRVYLPSQSATSSATPVDPPADYTTVEGEGYRISAPSEFQQQRVTSSNGEPALVLELPSSVAAVPQRVAVIRDVAPEASAAQQSYALEAAKSAGAPEVEVTREQLAAPEGQAAFLVTWQETRPSQGAANVEVTYWQLFHQVSEDLILNVVAFAPTTEFADSEVSTVLRTFEVRAS